MISKKLKDIANALQMHRKHRDVDEVPEGWWTMNEYMDANNVSQSTATRHLNALKRNNKVEGKSFVIKTFSKTYPVPHYRTL
jgi:hypothetical protein